MFLDISWHASLMFHAFGTALSFGAALPFGAAFSFGAAFPFGALFQLFSTRSDFKVMILHDARALQLLLLVSPLAWACWQPHRVHEQQKSLTRESQLPFALAWSSRKQLWLLPQPSRSLCHGNSSTDLNHPG